jgi:hypothetical protein
VYLLGFLFKIITSVTSYLSKFNTLDMQTIKISKNFTAFIIVHLFIRVTIAIRLFQSNEIQNPTLTTSK